MLKPVSKIEDEQEKRYVYILMKRKKLKKYSNIAGYLCYDEEEYENYKKHSKKGRPIKW